MPDTVQIESLPPPETGLTTPPPRLMTKLCIYIRINFYPDAELRVPEIRLVMPDNTNIRIGQFDTELVSKAKADANEKGNICVVVISRIALEGFRSPDKSIIVEADINGEE